MKITLTESQVKKIVKILCEESFLDVTKMGPESTKFFDLISSLANSSPGDGQTFNTTDNDATNLNINTKELFHPLGRKKPIRSYFGDNRGHKGVDIPTPSGSPVYAPTNGVILYAGDTTPNRCGGYVQIDHGMVITKFCHLKKWVVKQGEKVKKGQIIGYSGGGLHDPYKGRSTGPHLHYEILNAHGIAMNPVTVQNNLV